MIDNSKEYLLCAAVRRKKTRDCHKHYNVEDIYDIELGWRHCDIYSRFMGEMDSVDQGFFTSKGRYVSRKEGEEIARACGQVEGRLLGSVLTSEDLY